MQFLWHSVWLEQCHWLSTWVRILISLKKPPMRDMADRTTSIGDLIDAFMAAMVIRSCQKVDGGLPSSVERKMWLNLVLDFLVGLVPTLGDLADALFRCNTKNAVLLERFLEKRAEQNRELQRGQQQQVIADDLGPPPRYEPARPEAAAVRQGTRDNGGWFSGFRRAREADVERGEAAPPQQPPRRGDGAVHSRPTN